MEEALAPALLPPHVGALGPGEEADGRVGVGAHVVDAAGAEVVEHVADVVALRGHVVVEAVVEVCEGLVEGEADEGGVVEEGKDVAGGQVVFELVDAVEVRRGGKVHFVGNLAVGVAGAVVF